MRFLSNNSSGSPDMSVKDLYRRMHKPKPRDPRAVARDMLRQKRIALYKERWKLSRCLFEQTDALSVK